MMITLKETRESISREPHLWKLFLFDFVDDFRYYKDLQAISDSFELGDDKFDALLASTAESLCNELKLEIPNWIKEIPACNEPFFVSGFENLKATAIVQSPLQFRIRKVFVMENFLSRV
jgi:hypothetical protein